jgi:hypothetical protein
MRAAEVYGTAFGQGLRPESKLTVSAWADQYRLLSQRASAEAGRWRTTRTPYLREIMDALSSHIERIRIHLVQKQIPGRHPTQSDRTVRTRHDQDSAGEFFGKNGVAAIARARALYQIPEHRALFDQRVDPLLGVALGHFDGRLYRHDWPRRVMDDVSQKVVAAFGAANLSAFMNTTCS